jgi:hypothetical protein
MAATMGLADLTEERIGAGCLFTVKLSGAEEVPGPGDSEGRGDALILVNKQAGAICFDIKVERITLSALAAHIHKGAAGAAGPIVVPFFTAPRTDGVARGCVINLNDAVIGEILSNPSNYYVNVHTSDFPNGALRGQLSGQS